MAVPSSSSDAVAAHLTVDLHTRAGTTVGTIDLDPVVFGAELHRGAMH